MTILFLHGWQSIPGGVKPSYLTQHGHTVFSPNLPNDDFEQAVRIAQQEFDEHQPDVVVESSRGGVVEMNSKDTISDTTKIIDTSFAFDFDDLLADLL